MNAPDEYFARPPSHPEHPLGDVELSKPADAGSPKDLVPKPLDYREIRTWALEFWKDLRTLPEISDALSAVMTEFVLVSANQKKRRPNILPALIESYESYAATLDHPLSKRQYVGDICEKLQTIPPRLFSHLLKESTLSANLRLLRAAHCHSRGNATLKTRFEIAESLLTDANAFKKRAIAEQSDNAFVRFRSAIEELRGELSRSVVNFPEKPAHFGAKVLEKIIETLSPGKAPQSKQPSEEHP